MRRILYAVGVLSLLLARSQAETLSESSDGNRFQLDLHVPDAALQALLPPEWKPNIATQGPAKDANIRAVFIDRITINGPDGKPVGKGSNRLVYLVAPVTDPSGARVQLVVGGLTEDPADAPGPFGVYLPATTHACSDPSSSAGGARPRIAGLGVCGRERRTSGTPHQIRTGSRK